MLVVIAATENEAADTTLGSAVTLAITSSLSDASTVRVLSPARVRALRQLAFAASDSGPLDEAHARVVAQRGGAGAVVVPVIVTLGARYRLTARLLQAVSGKPIAIVESAVVDSTQLLVALDDVVRRTRRTLGERAREPTSVQLPDLTTASLPALKHYAAGSAATERNQLAIAVNEYQAAVSADSTFALAYVQLGATYARDNRPTAAETAFVGAERLAARVPSRLTPREQTMVSSTIARWRGQPARAIAIREAWLALHPDDDAMAGSLAFDYLQAKRNDRAAALLERLTARDSLDVTAWVNLAVAYGNLSPHPPHGQAIAAWEHAFRLDSNQFNLALNLQQYTSALILAGRTTTAAAVFQQSLTRTPAVRARALRSIGHLALWNGHPRDAVAPLRESMELSARDGQLLSAARASLLLSHALTYAGDTTAARVERQHLLTLGRQVLEPSMLYWIGQKLARAGDLRGARELLDSLNRHAMPTNPVHRASRDLLAGEIAVAKGNTAAGIALITAGVANDSTVMTYESLAHAYARAGNLAQARRRYEALAATKLVFGWEGSLVQRLAPIRAAQLARQAGDSVAVARWNAVVAAQSPHADAQWPPNMMW